MGKLLAVATRFLVILALYFPFSVYAKTVTYSGPFTNTTGNAKGNVVIDLNIGADNALSGYFNLTQSPGEITLCGAGDITGSKQGNSIAFSFTSKDPDPGCGFDWGELFTINGTLSESGRLFEGSYSVAGQQGVFRVTTEFDWNAHNGLRHFYCCIKTPPDLRKAMEHSNIILQHSVMDDYILHILSDWQLDNDTASARINLLKNAQDFPTLRFLVAACYLKIGDLYKEEGNPEAAKLFYLNVVRYKSSDMKQYRLLAEKRLSQLGQAPTAPSNALSLKLNFDRDPVKSASAELREAAEENPTVRKLVKMTQCMIDVVPLAGKAFKLGKRTVKVLDRVEKVEGSTTLVIAVLQDIQTGEIIVRAIRVVGDVLEFVISGADCIVLLEEMFIAPPLPPSAIRPPITPMPVPTPIPPG